MKRTIDRHPIGFLAGLLLLALFGVLMLPDFASVACADHTAFCFRTRVTVSKSTSGALTDYPVAVTLNAKQLIDSDRMGDQGSDFFPIDPSAHEIYGFLQEVGTDADKTAFIQADVAGDAVNDVYFMFSGSASHKRNQGVLFHQSSGADAITVTDDATLDITDNLDVRAIVQADDPDQTGDVLTKINVNTGYAMRVTTTGSGELECAIGDGSTVHTVSTAWGGTEQAVACVFVAAAGNDLFIHFLDDIGDALGAATASADTDAASIATNATDISIGNSFDGVISEVEVRDSSGKVSQWSFNPTEITETQTGTSGNSWTWQGNVDDVIGNNDGSYSLVHDQSNITVTLGANTLTFASAGTESVLTAPDQIRNFGDSDFSTTSGSEVWRDFGLVGDALERAVGGTSMTTDAFRFGLLALLIIGMGIVIYKVMGDSPTRNTAMMMFAITAFGLAGAIEWITIWWAIIPSIAIFGLWLLVGRTASG